MKKFLLLMNGLFLISQISFGNVKEVNTPLSTKTVENSKFEGVVSKTYAQKAMAIERHRVWLNFTNAEGAFKQALVGYIAGATNGLDNLYDAVTIDSNPYVDFYSINNGNNLTIQGRQLPFVATDEIPLGYKTAIEGVFQISLDHVDGVLINQDVFLKDKTTGKVYNLKKEAYSFTTLTGRFNDRFVLVFMNATESKLGVSSPVVLDKQAIISSHSDMKGKLVIVSVRNNEITLNSIEDDINEVLVYSIDQKQLYARKNIDTDTAVIPNLGVPKQVLVIKTQLKNGKWTANKIIL